MATRRSQSTLKPSTLSGILHRLPLSEPEAKTKGDEPATLTESIGVELRLDSFILTNTGSKYIADTKIKCSSPLHDLLSQAQVCKSIAEVGALYSLHIRLMLTSHLKIKTYG